MLNNLTRTIFSSVIIVVTSLLTLQSASAGKPVFGNRWITGVWSGTSSNALPGAGTPEFSVTKEADADRFGTIVPGSVTINGAYYATMTKGYIKRLDIGYVFNGNNVQHVNSSRGENILPKKTYSNIFRFDVDALSLPAVIQNGIIAACNDTSRNSNGVSHFDFPVAMQIVAYRYQRGNTSINKRRDKLVQGFVRSKVNCISLTHAAAPPKILAINIDVKKLGAAHSCPRRIEVRTRIKYDAPKTAQFRFVHNGKQSSLITIKARKVVDYQPTPGRTFKRQVYLVDRVKFYNVGPKDHKFEVRLRGSSLTASKTIRVGCGPFKPSAMWMTLKQQKKASCTKNVTAKIRITANGPGTVLTKIKNLASVVMAIESIKVKRAGNQYIGKLKKVFKMGEIETQLMAVDANHSNLNSGWQQLKVTCLKPLKGTLSFQGADIGKCPRQVKVAYSVITSTPGKFKYQLDCTGGRHFAGKVTAYKTGPNTYLGVGVKKITLTKHEKVSCALKTKIGGQLKLLTAKGKSFSCKHGASDDLTVAPPPVSDDPIPPGFVVDPVQCKTNERLVRGRCIRIVIDCKRGFKLVRGKCIRKPVKCKFNEHKEGGKCVKNVISILCKKGFVLKGKKCIKKPGKKIKCKNGERRVGKRCACKPYFKRVRGRCIKPTAKKKAVRKNPSVRKKPAKPLVFKSAVKKGKGKKSKGRKNKKNKKKRKN